MSVPSPRLRKAGLAAAVVVMSLVVGFVASNFKIASDITAFMPDDRTRVEAALAGELAKGELSKTMIVALTAPDVRTAAAASKAFEAALRDHADAIGALSFIEGGPPPDFDRALWSIYHPRRLAFAARSASQAQALTTDDALKARAERLVARLRHPTSTLLARLAPSDPLLIIESLFENLSQSRWGRLRIVENRFVAADQPTAVLFLATHASAFNSKVQQPVLDAVQQAFDETNASMGGVLSLGQSGVNRFAVQTESWIRQDIKRITVVSLVCLALVMWLLFRSLSLVLLTMIPLAAGVLVGCAVTLAAFGEVHGVTLAFGASLIGVAIDYVIHLYCHHSVVHPDGGGRASMKTLRPTLVTGALTTIVGFAMLGWSSYRGLQEVALFSASGIAAALAVTAIVVAELVPVGRRNVALRERIGAWLGRALASLRRKRTLLWTVAAAAVALGVYGATAIQWNASLSDLNALDEKLVAEDAPVRALVGVSDQMHAIVSLGTTEEEALQVNDRVFDALSEAQNLGQVEAFRSVAQLLPSAERQRQVDAAIRNDATLWSRVRHAYDQAGVRPEALEAFRQELGSAPEPPLSFGLLAESTLGPLVRPFVLSRRRGRGVRHVFARGTRPRCDRVGDRFDRRRSLRRSKAGYGLDDADVPTANVRVVGVWFGGRVCSAFVAVQKVATHRCGVGPRGCCGGEHNGGAGALWGGFGSRDVDRLAHRRQRRRRLQCLLGRCEQE